MGYSYSGSGMGSLYPLNRNSRRLLPFLVVTPDTVSRVTFISAGLDETQIAAAYLFITNALEKCTWTNKNKC